ncbi:MAG: class I SAM-dependent methyltransferase [Methylohalobius sp.]
MFSCCVHAQAAERLFSRLSRYYLWRYRLLGLERSQRQLVAGLEKVGLAGASLLEIGCGIGFLLHHLLERGASCALGIDLSSAMLEEAKAQARRRGLSERVRYVQGDFLDLAENLEPVDIAILDKVICCYPDAEALLTRAAERARRAVALTYPRLTWMNRLGVRTVNGLLALSGSEFRTYLHDPQAVEAWLSQAGLAKVYSAKTLVWQTKVFSRL